MNPTPNQITECDDERLMMEIITDNSKVIAELQRQNDELVARVARLKQSQLNALEYIGSLDATPITIKLHDLVAISENESPAQSLQHIEGAAVERFITAAIKAGDLVNDHSVIQKLRQQSTNGSDGDE